MDSSVLKRYWDTRTFEIKYNKIKVDYVTNNAVHSWNVTMLRMSSFHVLFSCVKTHVQDKKKSSRISLKWTEFVPSSWSKWFTGILEVRYIIPDTHFNENNKIITGFCGADSMLCLPHKGQLLFFWFKNSQQ